MERATWPRTAKHFLQPPVDPGWESNFALLADRGLSFDLQVSKALSSLVLPLELCCLRQCLPFLSFDLSLQANPSQLKDAAAFLARHPAVPVVLDHIGALRVLT
eukprot:SAG22_NODE_617_length_8527_cov_70.297342_7_plen_104_part_00